LLKTTYSKNKYLIQNIITNFIFLKGKVLYINIYIILALAIVFLFSCKKDKIDAPVDVGYSYYPTKAGNWIVYQVDSIVYDDFTGTVDTFAYQLKEVIESDFIDNQGRNSQRIERYHRANDTLQWILKDVWYSNRTNTTAEKVEENVRYIKLIFPVKLSQEWNGNAYNYFDPQIYKYSDLYKSYDANSLHFDSTITVIQKEELNLILDDYAIEIFAKNVGLVYKKFRHLEMLPDSTITKGLDLTYTIQSFGQ